MSAAPIVMTFGRENSRDTGVGFYAKIMIALAARNGAFCQTCSRFGHGCRFLRTDPDIELTAVASAAVRDADRQVAQEQENWER